MKKINLLFTCAGRRNYLINHFKEALDGNGAVIAADNQENAPALIDADIAITICDIYSKKYIGELKAICLKHEVTAIISLNDLELPILAKHKKEFEAIGTRVLVSDLDIINVSFDKWETQKLLTSNGFLTPMGYIDQDEALEAVRNKVIAFPLILKPRWGSASIGIEMVENSKEFAHAIELLKIKLSRTILSKVSSQVLGSAILIQEKLGGVEYGLDILNDFSGSYYGTFARQKLSMRSGETDKAMSVVDSRLNMLGERISKLLRHIGNLDCDIFIEGEKIYVLEFNPRFGGGYPFSHEAGINSAAIYLAWLRGEKNVDQFNTYMPNISYAKCDRLLRIPVQKAISGKKVFLDNWNILCL